MKRSVKITLTVTGIILVGIAITTITFIYLLHGPYSQSRLIAKYEFHNIAAIQAAMLPVVDSLPAARPQIPQIWAEVPGFKAPIWPANRFFQYFTRNGPLEGNPCDINLGIIYNDIILIETHRWFNSKDWGLAYTTTTNVLPIPYWTKHMVGNWSAWYIDGNKPPETQGIWYK